MADFSLLKQAIRSHLLTPAPMANYTIHAPRSWYNRHAAAHGLSVRCAVTLHGPSPIFIIDDVQNVCLAEKRWHILEKKKSSEVFRSAVRDIVPQLVRLLGALVLLG